MVRVVRKQDRSMSSDASTVFLTFPPRGIGDGEREIVKQWLAETTDIAAAYASERRGDDPAHYRRIVIVEAGARKPGYLVHCPEGTDIWLLTVLGERESVRLFPNLRAALHAVRPIAGTQASAERKVPDWMGGGSANGVTRSDGLSGTPARTIAETAAGLRRPPAAGNAAAMPRRKLP
jgi:hypothetical protein